jgi:hypothetical protein
MASGFRTDRGMASAAALLLSAAKPLAQMQSRTQT